MNKILLIAIIAFYGCLARVTLGGTGSEVRASLIHQVLPLTRVTLADRFSGYRATAVKVLESHKHKCSLKSHKLINTVKLASVHFAADSEQVRAWAYPDNNVEYSRIFINVNVEWSEYKAVREMIHESLHAADICGPDNYSYFIARPFPACSLAGKNLYRSSQITEFLEEHLEKELSKLDKIEYKFILENK